MNAVNLDNEVKFIPEWIIEKNLDQNQIYAIRAEGEDASLVRETEKAILVAWFTEFGKVSMWCPKSVLKSKADYEAEIAEQETRFIAGCERYAKLVEAAKSLNIGIRNRMSTTTIYRKVNEAGKRAELDALLAA